MGDWWPALSAGRAALARRGRAGRSMTASSTDEAAGDAAERFMRRMIGDDRWEPASAEHSRRPAGRRSGAGRRPRLAAAATRALRRGQRSCQPVLVRLRLRLGALPPAGGAGAGRPRAPTASSWSSTAPSHGVHLSHPADFAAFVRRAVERPPIGTTPGTAGLTVDRSRGGPAATVARWPARAVHVVRAAGDGARPRAGRGARPRWPTALAAPDADRRDAVSRGGGPLAAVPRRLGPARPARSRRHGGVRRLPGRLPPRARPAAGQRLAGQRLTCAGSTRRTGASCGRCTACPRWRVASARTTSRNAARCSSPSSIRAGRPPTSTDPSRSARPDASSVEQRRVPDRPVSPPRRRRRS